MKILFDNVNFSARTGPNTFAKRLAEQLYVRGHTICTPQEKYDVALVFIEPRQQFRQGAKVVQRLDGIWFKPEMFEENNRSIKACYDSADLVVWQSEFDKGMSTHWWNNPKNGVVIRNGINLKPVEKITSPGVARLRNSYDKIFVASANWHPQKRLKANIELFDHCRKSFYPNSCLVIMGANPDVRVSYPHIFFTGSIAQEEYLQVFVVSNWMLHLSWLDHCPNTVIESLSQGTQVICSEAGGTKELVGEYGLVLKEKEQYNYELADYDNPPDIDVTQVSEPLPEKPFGDHANIDIEDVAADYEEALEKIL